ncbi:hypothetical protein J6590_033897 [Homalodisca vitripennis]|nr:hypothetical protein J6590_033897 [Homalodisca vitripennis]
MVRSNKRLPIHGAPRKDSIGSLTKATLESQASLLPCRWLRDVTVRGGLRLNQGHTLVYSRPNPPGM